MRWKVKETDDLELVKCVNGGRPCRLASCQLCHGTGEYVIQRVKYFDHITKDELDQQRRRMQ